MYPTQSHDERPTIRHRRRYFGAVVAFVLLLAMLPFPPGSRAATPALNAQISAAGAMVQLDRDFFSPHLGLYAITGDKYGPSASLWPTSQVLAGAIDVARYTHAKADMNRVRRIIASLHFYTGQGGVYHTRVFPTRRYTDDNNWVALDLLDAFQLLHEPAYLTQAERIFDYLVANWDAAHGGGIKWADGHPELPTVSTAPAVTVGFRLAFLTHRTYYRTWAERFYAWENSHMRAANGLYWDHIRADRTIDTDLVSYNQGAMIEANLAYAALTGAAQYLDRASAIARASARAFPMPWRKHGADAAYNAIYVRALVDLATVRPKAVDMRPAQDYVLWARSNTLAARGVRTEAALLEQAALVITAAAL